MPAEPQTLYSSVTDEDKCLNIDQVLPGLCEPFSPKQGESSTTTVVENVKNLAEQWNAYLSTCKFLSKEAPGYETVVSEGLGALHHMLQITSSIPYAASSGEQSTICAPGPMAHEKDGTQPFYRLLLQAIGECCKPAGQQPSPTKNAFRHEVPIPPTTKRPKRIMDFLKRRKSR